MNIGTLDHSRIHARQNACGQFSSVATLCPLKGLRQTGHVLGAGFRSPAAGPGVLPSAMLQTGETHRAPGIVSLRPTQVLLIPLMMLGTWAQGSSRLNSWLTFDPFRRAVTWDPVSNIW